MSAIWHDLECGPYVEDLQLWRSLAEQEGDPVLDVGAGTGRVTLDLVKHGHRVVALDQDPELLAELGRRTAGRPVETVPADARSFDLGRRFPLCLIPMQTIQLLGGPAGRREFLVCAARHLEPGGLLAISISEQLEPFEVLDGMEGPYPDIVELGGVVYSSQPTAVRLDGAGFVLERRRETVTAGGQRTVEENAIHLDRVSAEELEAEARPAGLRTAGRVDIPETSEYTGSTVVMLRA
jgi:SAM-dependent methyltransferase